MDWSKISPKILDVLACKHIVYYEDYPSFAGVCKSWHLAALQAAKGNGPPSRLPSLMLSEKIGDVEFRELFLLSKKTIRKIRLPEVHGKLCMSSCGWLVTVANDHSSQLINPLSREIFNLPKTDTYVSFIRPSEKETSFSKLVFLAQWSLVVVLWRSSRELAFCRVGDNKWTPADDKAWHGIIMDITYYGGRIYTCDVNLCIQAWDQTKIGKVTRLPKDVVNTHYADGDLNGVYIMGFDEGERKRLLVVMRKGMFDYGNGVYDYQTQCFQVWGYDLGKKKGKWSRVNDLGTKSLFVGHSSSFWVEQDTIGAIKGNCIYFTDDVTESYRNCKTGGGRDMGIYHLSDGTIEPHFTGESRSRLTPPIWLQSM
nr:hypothetical protein [Tanacetum cinerariifolium]